MIRDRAISIKYLAQSHMYIFSKKFLFCYFGNHFEFLCKSHKCICMYFRNGAIYLGRISGLEDMYKGIYQFPKNHCPLIFIGRLEFLHKTQNTFILGCFFFLAMQKQLSFFEKATLLDCRTFLLDTSCTVIVHPGSSCLSWSCVNRKKTKYIENKNI